MSIIIDAIKNIFKKPFTEQFPKERKRFWPRYRGKVIYDIKKCIRCQRCVKACPNEALSFKDNHVVVDRTRCILCGACEEVCPVAGKAIRVVNELSDVS